MYEKQISSLSASTMISVQWNFAKRAAKQTVKFDHEWNLSDFRVCSINVMCQQKTILENELNILRNFVMWSVFVW